MDRRPARTFHRDRPFAAKPMPTRRDRLAQGWNAHRPARRDTYAATSALMCVQRHDAGPRYSPGQFRALPHPAYSSRCLCLCRRRDAQPAYGAGKLRGLLFHRAPDQPSQRPRLRHRRAGAAPSNLVADPEKPSIARHSSARATDGRNERTAATTELLDRCLKQFDWAGKAHLQGPDRPGRITSSATASCFVEGGASGPSEAAHGGAHRRQRVGCALPSARASKPSCRRSRRMRSKSRWTAFVSTMARRLLLKEGWGSISDHVRLFMGGNAVVDAATKLLKRFARPPARKARPDAGAE